MHDWGSWGEPGPGTTPARLLLPSPPLCAPIIDEIAAAKAVVKFVSEEMAALTLSTIDEGGGCPSWSNGGSLCEKNNGLIPSSCVGCCICNGRGTLERLRFCVKSRVIVGKGWEADRVLDIVA